MFFVPKIVKRYSVSIFIPAYNEQDSLEGTVKTVLASDYGNIAEVIIINEGVKQIKNGCN